MTTENNKKPSDAAMRAADTIVWVCLNAKGEMTAGDLVAAVARNIDGAWNEMASALDTPTNPIKRGDVVTLASGGELWVVVKWSKSEEQWLCRKDVIGAEPVDAWFYPCGLRKVEPEPPRPEMDEETHDAIKDAVNLVLCSTRQRFPDHTMRVLQRWLDAQGVK